MATDWFPAKVIETFDYPDERTIKVTYDGWPKKWNEWIGGTSRVRNRVFVLTLERCKNARSNTILHKLLDVLTPLSPNC